jgi:hypothetical protein
MARPLLTEAMFSLRFFGHANFECNKFLNFLNFFEAIDMDGSFPMSRSI